MAISPFMNSLPVNRLNPTLNDVWQIAVIYCNLLTGEVKKVWQWYTKLSNGKFRYENVPNDFEAIILIDEFGLVADYSPLFIQWAMQVDA